MRRCGPAAVAALLTVLVACGDLFAPPLKQATLALVPAFGEVGLLQSEVDRLRVRIYRDSSGAFEAQPKVDQTLTLTADSVISTFTLPIASSPVRVLVRLDAIRSSDGAVLFTSVDTAEVREQSGEEPVPLTPRNVRYVGPPAVSIAIVPRDTAVEAGSSFTFRATALDAAGGRVPVRFGLVNRADTVAIRLDRITGLATTVAGAEATVSVFARTADSALADTTRVLVGPVPVGVATSPGYATVGVGGSVQFTGAVVDALGNAITIFPVNWTSRSPAVATVDGTGLVAGVAPGTAVMIANAPDFTGAAFTDSVLVTVPTAGNVVVSTTSDTRAFRRAQVGDTVIVDVAVDVRATPDELLGSYNAVLTWDPAVLAYDTLLAGDFPEPQTNEANAASGELRFAQANAAGASGVVVVARVRFTAVAAGTTSPVVTISEISAAATFTNLIDRVTVTNGTVTIQ